MSDRDLTPWETRVPGAPTSGPPTAPQQGADLKALQDAMARPRRERDSVARARAEEARRKQEQLAKRARRHERSGQASAIIGDRRVHGALIAAVVAVLAVFVVWPQVTTLLNPPLSLQQLQAERGPLDLAATQALNVAGVQPSVHETAATFLVTYKVPADTPMIDDRMTASACKATYMIDRKASRPGDIRFEPGEIVPCSPGKKR